MEEDNLVNTEATATCLYCGDSLWPETRIEFLAPTEQIGEEFVVLCAEQSQCRQCGEWTSLRNGFGYWSQESWNALADADRLEWEEEPEAVATDGHAHLCLDCGAILSTGNVECESDYDHAFERCDECAAKEEANT
jgi:hypothetical protein